MNCTGDWEIHSVSRRVGLSAVTTTTTTTTMTATATTAMATTVTRKTTPVVKKIIITQHYRLSHEKPTNHSGASFL